MHESTPLEQWLRLLVFFPCDYLSSVSQEQIHQVMYAKNKSILPFIFTLIHTGAVADPVNFSVAVKHLKKNYCHMLMFYLPPSPLLSLSPTLPLSLYPSHPGHTSRALSLSSKKEHLPMGNSSTLKFNYMPAVVCVYACACVRACVHKHRLVKHTVLLKVHCA